MTTKLTTEKVGTGIKVGITVPLSLAISIVGSWTTEDLGECEETQNRPYKNIVVGRVLVAGKRPQSPPAPAYTSARLSPKGT